MPVQQPQVQFQGRLNAVEQERTTRDAAPGKKGVGQDQKFRLIPIEQFLAEEAAAG